MRERNFFLVVFLLLSVVLVAPVQVSARTEYVLVGHGAIGFATVMAPDHPPIMVEVIDFKLSNFGPHDILSISVWMETPEYTGFMPWVAVTDNAECAVLMEELYVGMPVSVVLVGERDLQVWSLFRRVTAVLRVPVEGETPEGPLTIHPFTMKLKGHGLGEWMEETEAIPGYTMSSKMKAYEATATVTCPDGSEWPAEEGAMVGLHMKFTLSAS